MAKKKKRYLIYIYIILVLIAGSTLLVLFQLNPLLVRFTKNKLESLVNQDPDRLYDITYDSLKIDIYSGNISVFDFSIKPRKQILDSLAENNIPRKIVIDFHLGDFKLIDIELIKFLKSGEIELDAVLFENLTGKVYVNDTLKAENSVTVSTDLLTQSFISTLLHKVELKNGSLDWINTVNDSSINLSFDNFYVHMADLYTDSAMIKKPHGIAIDEISFSFENFQNKLVKNYIVKSKKVTFNSFDNKYSIVEPEMIPTQEKVDSQNYLKLHVSEVELIGINYDSLLYNDHLLVDRVRIKEPQFTYVRPPQRLQKDTLRFLPAYTFKSIPIGLYIDTIEIRNGLFDYLKHGYNEPLVKLDAHNLNVDGLNFSSDPKLMPEDKTFYVTGSGLFLNEAPLLLKFRFPITDPHSTFFIEAEMDTINAESLNQIVKNSKQFMIKSGIINRMTFNINGNDTLARGTLNIDYKNLKLQAIKVNEEDFTDVKRKGFNTFLMNTFAKTKNDPARTSFKEGIIYLERNDNWTFLDYSLDAMMTGILTSMVPEAKGMVVPKEERKAIKKENK